MRISLRYKNITDFQKNVGSSLVKAMKKIFLEAIFMWYIAIALHFKSCNHFTLKYIFSLKKKITSGRYLTPSYKERTHIQ